MYTYQLSGSTHNDSKNYGATVLAINSLREIFDLSLKQAKDLVDATNQSGKVHSQV